MALITWNDALSVNIAEIDRQHQKLIVLINNLNDAMRQGKGKESLGKIITELVDYAATHFSLEEKYFAKFGYPQAAAHIKEHDTFVGKVKEFKKGFEDKKLSLTVEIMTFLSDWLLNHIKKSDKQYAPFLKSKGLK
jgi:hemerythrin